jgi:hypothetical protein
MVNQVEPAPVSLRTCHADLSERDKGRLAYGESTES